ncbi:MAG: hypothetical protein K0S01_2445 [Herbinix sp.]|jgi:Ser/Thr protein kinase RdoA (MazF antagonist)|nr:hypothetical protein [Herbinix sp.]
MYNLNELKNRLQLTSIDIINSRMDVEVYKVYKNEQPFFLKIHNQHNNFIREVEAIKQLSKKMFQVPNLVEVGTFSGSYFFIQEWWEGDTLLSIFSQMDFAEKKDTLFQAGQLLGKLNFCMTEDEIKSSELWKYAYEGISNYNSYSWKNIYVNQFPKWLDIIDLKFQDNGQSIKEALYKTMAKIAELDEACRIGVIHRDYGLRNLMIKDGKLIGAIDFEYMIAGDPIFDLSKLIFNDISYNDDIELRNSFFLGWQSQTHMEIPQERLQLYLAVQGAGAIQWVDKQPATDREKYKEYRNKGIDILLSATRNL